MNLEKKLATAIKSNDAKKIEQVFEEIYYAYGRLVGYVISKYVPQSRDAEELVDDVFVNFSKKMFDGKINNIKNYLAVSAKNTTVNFIKRTSDKNIIYDERYIPENTTNTNCSIYSELVFEMQKHLSEEEIDIILLHAVYGYTFAQIAKMRKRPSTTISSLYSRAIKKIKGKISKNDFE